MKNRTRYTAGEQERSDSGLYGVFTVPNAFHGGDVKRPPINGCADRIHIRTYRQRKWRLGAAS